MPEKSVIHSHDWPPGSMPPALTGTSCHRPVDPNGTFWLIGNFTKQALPSRKAACPDEHRMGTPVAVINLNHILNLSNRTRETHAV